MMMATVITIAIQYMPQELPGESDVDRPNVKWFGMRHVADEEL